MPSLLKETVTIQMTFGSEIQRAVSLKTLRQLLREWQKTVEDAHKKNNITITEG